jgi:hypothetical protein
MPAQAKLLDVCWKLVGHLAYPWLRSQAIRRSPFIQSSTSDLL